MNKKQCLSDVRHKIELQSANTDFALIIESAD